MENRLTPSERAARTYKEYDRHISGTGSSKYSVNTVYNFDPDERETEEIDLNSDYAWLKIALIIEHYERN